jgi:hypothetical protein
LGARSNHKDNLPTYPVSEVQPNAIGQPWAAAVGKWIASLSILRKVEEVLDTAEREEKVPAGLAEAEL